MLSRIKREQSSSLFRSYVADFLDSEVVPHYPAWERDRLVPRDAWKKAGAAGLLCRTIPAELGGHNCSFEDSVVIIEELAKRRLSGFLLFLQSDIVAPYILNLGTHDQKEAWLPGMATGEVIGAIAMTEPHSGSDITSHSSHILPVGDGFRLTGTKTHISNGFCADVVVVAARSAEARENAFSLVLTDPRDPAVFRTPIPKTGMRGLDTAEIKFQEYPLTRGDFLGEPGIAYMYLMYFLAIERLALAIYALANAKAILRDLVVDCSVRESKGKSILSNQAIQFKLAELHTECIVNQSFVDSCVRAHLRGVQDPQAACVAKICTTATLNKCASLGIQLRGANGISGESGVDAGRDLLDASVQSIWGGSTETLLDVVGKSLKNWS